MKRHAINRIAIGFAALIAFALPAMAATESVLYSFPNSGTGYPSGTLYFRNGSLYGTGAGDEKSADGQVFKLTNKAGSWKEKTLLTFDGANGSTPFAGLLRDSNGVLYGTTWQGGAYNGGAVFALVKSGGKWAASTIWAFGGKAGDGTTPTCNLVMDKSGNLFGTTYQGGAQGVGIVFELSKANGTWTETILHSFANNPTDGWEPYAGLLMAGPGKFYGTTQYGGSQGGNGTVFELFRSGGVWKEKVLYSFTGGADGGEPWAPLIRDKEGDLYGTTYAGGYVVHGYADIGTVFELVRSKNQWKERVLHDFGGNGDPGINPVAGLRWGPSGQLYGTTAGGGGTAFELTQSNQGTLWTYSVLHEFGDAGDGVSPQGAVTLDKNGNLYGTTAGGGSDNLGTVWKITP